MYQCLPTKKSASWTWTPYAANNGNLSLTKKEKKKNAPWFGWPFENRKDKIKEHRLVFF